MKIIEITVTADGESKVETIGFIGAECRDASRFIEQALGVSKREKLKSEFHQTQRSTSQQTRQA